MNRSRTWAILIGVFVVAVLFYIFFATGGREEVQDLDTPGATVTEDSPTATDEGAATSTEPGGD